MKEIKIDTKKDLIFDYKVREQCKSCKRYGKKVTCPPYIEDIDYYRKLLPKYKNAIIYYSIFKIKNVKNWKRLGKKSSLVMHKYILNKRIELINKGHYFVIGFGAVTIIPAATNVIIAHCTNKKR